ncbi:magnesium transporter [Virgibacillus sp. NKC19-3]|uniref:magnesium transporter n=1 Tax=Virgibacillus saliphilus TaxID=2831674 RepID=UPI001C9B38E6|nr:magnesium transporter [Virgibacillus sp. NKC19-3]MBY7141533.1 magnesium transporter [Virgibacillus sp. NKC19-3]
MGKLTKKKRAIYTKTVLDALHNGKKQQFRDTFLELHPFDQSDMFKTMDVEARNLVYSFLSPKEFTAIFSNLDIQDQKLFFLEMDENYASSIFNHLFTDDVVQFLTEINSHRADEILEQMDDKKAHEIRAILSYAHETAGAIMTKELISIPASATVEAVLDKLRNEAPDAEIIYYLYVVDAQKELVGVVSLRDLIIAKPDTTIENAMSTNVVSVSEDMDQEEVGMVIKKYDLLAVPVVSHQNQLLGIVTVDDVLDILEEEATEDFGEISATKGATDVSISPFKAAKKRAPWIIVLMLLSLITGGVIDRFEETLESVVLLAAFIPMIMGSGGNVGTQSLAVSVRGLALGTVEKSNLWRMIRREFSTGALLGLICMVIIAAIILVIYGNGMLGVIVGISTLCTLSVSAVVGSVIPLIINKLNFDPAIASGPFITTLNDIIGLMIYFSIATQLMEFL